MEFNTHHGPDINHGLQSVKSSLETAWNYVKRNPAVVTLAPLATALITYGAYQVWQLRADPSVLAAPHESWTAAAKPAEDIFGKIVRVVWTMRDQDRIFIDNVQRAKIAERLLSDPSYQDQHIFRDYMQKLGYAVGVFEYREMLTVADKDLPLVRYPNPELNPENPDGVVEPRLGMIKRGQMFWSLGEIPIFHSDGSATYYHLVGSSDTIIPRDQDLPTASNVVILPDGRRVQVQFLYAESGVQPHNGPRQDFHSEVNLNSNLEGRIYTR